MAAGRSEARINSFLVGQGVGTLPRDRLATAFTRRLVYRAEIGMSRGEDLSRILGEERAGLVDLAKRMGVDERDASRLENIVTRYERQINEALALGPGDTMVGYRSINAANAGKADSPFHEVWDATETTFKRLDREAEDLSRSPMQASLTLNRCHRRSNRSSLRRTSFTRKASRRLICAAS